MQERSFDKYYVTFCNPVEIYVSESESESESGSVFLKRGYPDIRSGFGSISMAKKKNSSQPFTCSVCFIWSFSINFCFRCSFSRPK